jgi:ABC-type antimicrobial peptide transport system permease subunit
VQVVGVVEDASRGGLVEEPFLQRYLPLAQAEGVSPRALYVRAAGDPTELLPRLRDELRAAVPEARYVEARTLREILDPQARSWTLGATMFSVFGLLALVVAAIGLYSVLAFDVAQRTHELGVRAALGASRDALVRMVVGSGLRLTVVGVGLGALVALAAGGRLEPLLFRVSPRDPAVYGCVAATLLLVGVLASVLPGLRATRVSPSEALRRE